MGEKVTADFNRQSKIYNPKEQRFKVLILGAGSTGSFVALTLAKMGVNNIRVVDFDKIEKHNIPNQFYRLEDVGKKKVEALKEIIESFTGVKIITETKKIGKKYNFEVDGNTIVICCVDSMKSRRVFFEALEGFPIWYIDTRFGGEGYSIHVLNLIDEGMCESYEEGLKGEIKETGCGEKAIIFTILSLASEVCNIVKKIEKKEVYPELLRRELKTYKFIKSLREDGKQFC